MQNVKKRFFLEARKRLPGYLIAVFFLWPLISVLLAIQVAKSLPYHQATVGQALLISAGGMAVLMPDIAVIGSLCFFVCLVLFSFLASLELIEQNNSRMGFIAEPVIIFFTVLFGASLYYPAILSHPIFTFFDFLPVWVLILILACITLGWGILLALPGHRISIVAILFICAILAPLPTLYRNQIIEVPLSPPPIVLLGIDSLSHSDDLSQIKKWTQANGGAWYTHAVSPGLLTNAVWASILLMKPVSEHGVFHTFQSYSGTSGGSILEEARKQGYYIVSVFTDQLTCWIESDYAFDRNLSGPKGWRQLATNICENTSILLPLIRPLLPRLPFSSVPPNHAGTFSYSIEREFNEILSQSSTDREILVIGHSGYPHVPGYPKYFDLSWEEFKKVLRTPASRVKDRSFDWQDVDRADDAIPVRLWKVKRVQTAITDAMDRSRFLKRGGKMILFSDHGDRIGLSEENFHDVRYYHVMFATFGFPVRDVSLPISLIDSSSLLGLAHNNPFHPLVEYANSNPSEWSILVRSARFEWDGSVNLDASLLSNIFHRLRSYRPWTTVSSLKAESDQGN